MNEAQQPLNALPQGYRLQEYELVRVLGFGGFGMTYLGFDHNLNKAVAIKEYLPSDIAIRTNDNSVAPQVSQFQDDFEWGLERFLDEARTLARFDHRNIIKVYRFFEAHSTAYIVMEYAEGETLAAFLERKGTLTEAELRAILYPLLDGLEVVHRADFLHRDIKPGNIIIRDEDNSPVLLDFGSARQAMGARSRSVTSIITPGYAPIEQYSSRGDQGPWTDIYALGGVCYRTLTGEVPDDVTDRVRNDPLIPVSELCAGQESASFLSAIDWALSVDEGDRPQSINVWRTALGEETPRIENVQPSVTASVPASPLEEEKREAVVGKTMRQPDAFPSERERGTRGKLLAVIGSVVAVLIAGIIYIDQAEKQQKEQVALEKQRQELVEEKARLAAEQAEKQRQEQAALEKQRQEQALLEKQHQERATERARLAAEQAEKRRQEQEAEKTRRLAKWRDPKTGRTSLHDAAYKNAPETAEVLLKHGADPNAQDRDGHTPLYNAVRKCSREVVELLLKQGADVNAKSNFGGTPLHEVLQTHVSAVIQSRKYSSFEKKRGDEFRKKAEVALDIFKLLLKHGADVNAKNNFGGTPLHSSIMYNSSDETKIVEMAELLLKHGADVNAKDNGGLTPLHTGAHNAKNNQISVEMAELLLKYGADPNTKDKDGRTPLHWAAWNINSHKFAELLLKHGADVNAKDNLGETPLHDARMRSPRTAGILRRYGGQ